MGLIDQAYDLVETEIDNVKENVKDVLDQADYDFSGAIYDSILTTKVGKVIGWAQKNALWPATFGLACCAIEMMAMANSRWDAARFGAEVFRASPRQADLMIVSGRVSQKMAPVLKIIFDIEVVFMYPWAVSLDQLKLFGLIEMLVFIFILGIAYVYIWGRGGLEWD